MKRSLFAICLLLSALTAAAEEADPMAVCDDRNTACISKCDSMENTPPECYEGCDTAYRRCLDIANGYTPEAPAVTPAQETKADTAADQPK